MRIVVGSSSQNFKRKYISDLDVWVSDSNYKKKGSEDISVMPIEILESFSETSKIDSCATPSDLMTIKLSHLPYDINWWKHVQDYLVLKIYYECELNKPLYEKLKIHWKKEHKNKDFLSLYKKKDEFFDDFVPKKHDHDWLHEQVAYPNEPIYKRCLKDGQDVLIDKNKFLKLSFEDQVRMFREEINVIAFERWLLNPKVNIQYQEAYSRSLHKTITALTKGWASEFICENLEHFIKSNINDIGNLLTLIKENKMEPTIDFKEFCDELRSEEYQDGLEHSEVAYGSIPEGTTYKDEPVTVIEMVGGEGEGEHAHLILSVGDKFYKMDFSYYSYNGFEYDGCELRLVKPVSKQITVYE